MLSVTQGGVVMNLVRGGLEVLYYLPSSELDQTRSFCLPSKLNKSTHKFLPMSKLFNFSIPQSSTNDATMLIYSQSFWWFLLVNKHTWYLAAVHRCPYKFLGANRDFKN